jgi:hypothetical protein
MWSRKQAIAASPPLATWPTAVTDALDAQQVQQYEQQVDAMKRYFAGEPVADISRLTGVARSRLSELAKKCLLPASDGNILGFRALLPYMRLKDYERTAEEKRKFPEAMGGHAGVLGRLLLRFPEIEDTLVMHIRQEAKHLQIPEHKLRARDLHRIFIKLLGEMGASRTEWPFTAKYRGKRSIERYMRDVLDRNFAKTVSTREEQEARAHLNVGTGHEAFLIYDEPYAAIEIDAYSIESHLTVAFKTPEGTETDVLLERLWLIAAVDRFSSAILAYNVVYRSEVNADEVLKVIRQAATGRWKPMDLTIPGLKYPAEAGLPNGVIPNAHGAVWSSMLFDGALAHLSKTVHERARKVLGCAINWGPVAHFERRPNVERTFNQIAMDLFKRLPSTTGSGPKNGRAENAEAKAVRHRIRADDIEQLLDITVAQHNATPGEGNSFLSPLDVLRYFLDDPHQRFLVRRLPAQQSNQAETFASREVATVRGGPGTGRRPYVQIDRVHYTSPVLANAGHLVGQSLILEIDNEDMRQVTAYLPNGAELGVLKAKGKWGFTKHSRRTRLAINSLLSKRVITVSEFDDPVQAYMRHIAQPAKSKKDKSLTPRQATQLVQLAKETGQPPRLPSPKSATPAATPERSATPARSRLMDTENTFFTRVKNRR